MDYRFRFHYLLVFLVLLFASEMGVKAEQQKQYNKIATIISTKVICKEQGKHIGPGSKFSITSEGHPIITKRVKEPMRYLGWPTITKTRDGELLVVFSGDRDSHLCPWGKTQIIRSSDNGKTWSEPVTINNTPLDDRDAGIIETKKGTLLVNWFTSMAFSHYGLAAEKYARHAEKITPDVREKWLGKWVRRSNDGGKTWQEPVRTVAGSPHGPIQLRDSRLLYVGTGKLENKKVILVEESSDDGCSWKVISSIPISSENSISDCHEPHLVELTSGKLVAMIRYHGPPEDSCNFLLQSESYDSGKTWSVAHTTPIWGYPPHLIQLENGWLVAVYGRRIPPYGERACLSRDEGKSWDVENEIILYDAISEDLGYPSSVQLDDGSIITVFCQIDKPGESTCLMRTHWQLR